MVRICNGDYCAGETDGDEPTDDGCTFVAETDGMVGAVGEADGSSADGATTPAAVTVVVLEGGTAIDCETAEAPTFAVAEGLASLADGA